MDIKYEVVGRKIIGVSYSITCNSSYDTCKNDLIKELKYIKNVIKEKVGDNCIVVLLYSTNIANPVYTNAVAYVFKDFREANPFINGINRKYKNISVYQYFAETNEVSFIFCKKKSSTVYGRTVGTTEFVNLEDVSLKVFEVCPLPFIVYFRGKEYEEEN